METRTRWPGRRRVLVLAAVLVVVALVGAWLVWSASRPAPAPATQVVRATVGDQTTTVSLSGVLSPQQQANVSFAVPGTVETVSARVGDRVEAGQQLAVLDDRDLRNAVTLAEAQLAAARAQLQTLRDTGRSSSAQIAAARAGVATAQAGVDRAAAQLADARLAAPIAGVVAEVAVKVGDQVSGASGLAGAASSRLPAGLPGLSGVSGASGSSGGSSTSAAGGAAVVIVVPDAWQLEAQVGTSDLPALKKGQPAVVTPTGTSTHVTAAVDTIGIVASGASGQSATFPVTLTITQAGAPLFSGSNADAVITTDTVRGVLTVPGEAVTYRDGKAFVRRPDGTASREVEVGVGRRFGDRVEVVRGLVEGDEVLRPTGVVVSRPPRPQFGPGGSFASPDPTPTPSR